MKPIRICEKDANRHKKRDNAFGVTWCIVCGRLFTKPSNVPLNGDWQIKFREFKIRNNMS